MSIGRQLLRKDYEKRLAAGEWRGLVGDRGMTAGCPASANSERSLYAASDEALYVAKWWADRVAVAPRLKENLPGVESDKQ
jgi:hypothetical protein